MRCDDRIARRALLAGITLWPAARRLWGQDPKPTFTADVKVVNILATVRDKKGVVVKGLPQDEFVLLEDGRPQVIRYFAQESNLPLTVGLLVDTSGSTRTVLGEERNASHRFLDQVLREDRDFTFVIHFDYDVELLQDLTSSPRALERALAQLETAGDRQMVNRGGGNYPGSGGSWPGGGGGYPFPGGRRGGGPQGRGAGGTALYDAVFLAADEVLKKQSGRKAIILFSDGEDTGSKVSQEECVEAAQRADTLVYSILFEGEGIGFFGGRSGRGGRVLNKISSETGGNFFEVTRKKPLEQIFTEIEEDLRNQYSLGYVSDRTDGGESYRRIKLSTKRKGLVVQTREGYYAKV
jgi:VWFA-related protein